MGSITLNKPSGGQLTIAPEDGATNETVTIPSVGVGKVLQQQTYVSSAGNDVSISTSGSVVFDTFTITVKEGSKVVLWFNTAQYVQSTLNTNLQLYLEVDGVVLSGNTDNATDFNHINYQISGRNNQTNWFVTDSLSEGSHTLTLRAGRYNSGTMTLNYQGKKFRYLLQEVAA